MSSAGALMHQRLQSHAAAASRTVAANATCNKALQLLHMLAPRTVACHRHQPLTTCTAAKTSVDSNLSWVPAENRLEVQRVLELAQKAERRWEVACTESFLSPPVAADAMSALAGVPGVKAVLWGGYSQAERCRLLLGREDVVDGGAVDPGSSGVVAAIQVKGNFMFDPAKHPDFLGAILGTGVVRERVGDILVQGEQGAQILVHPDLVEHFETTLTQVRTVPVKTERIELSALRVPPPSVQELQSVEASLRVDALASAGFRMSRSKMSDLVKAGSVRVNWRTVSKASADLKAGDVVSVSGKGRLEIREVVARTKKDVTKYAVTMVRYT